MSDSQYFLGEDVQSLCELLNHVHVGTHKITCIVCFEGRSKIYKDDPVSEWEATIGGHKVPMLTPDELKEIKVEGEKSFGEKMKAHMDEVKTSVILYDPEACKQDMQKYLWDEEITQLNSMETFKLTTQLQSMNPQDKLMALFTLAGKIVMAGEAGMLEESEHNVKCYGVKRHLTTSQKSLFMQHEVGGMYMTLDKPFVLQMAASSYAKQDVLNGIQVVYCFKYKVGGNDGITIMRAGIMFLQLLTTQHHWTNLWAVASIMKEKMGEFGSKVACMPMGSPASGSAYVSTLVQPLK